MSQKLYQAVETVWDYMLMHQNVEKADLILVLCSNDLRVAEYAAQLYQRGMADTLVFSGGVGRFTHGKFAGSEAETFAAVAQSMGVDRNAMYLETESTNSGENVLFSYQLIQKLGLANERILLVQKPFMERRALATFEKQWPDNQCKVQVTSPPLGVWDYFCDELPSFTVISALIEDFQRVKDYPALGFQTAQDIPEEVEQAYQQLKPIFASAP
ncbi:YdcF family protein [Vibrio sp.]|uniref:YdcF family protein n=1 Tax=Vibrio sp. TaxID=678 RepID=UPI003D0A96AD